jgi:peptide/nickel transport system substrate-binding protein
MTQPSALRRRMSASAVVLALGLVAVACGSDSKTTSTSAGGVSPATAAPASGDSTAPSGTDASAPATGKSIVISIADEPSTLDPQAQEDGNERAITDNIYETLLRRDAVSNELIPWLATELPTQVSPTTWEFKLRQGVTFSNGDPFNAAAAAFSINRVMDPAYETAQRDFYGKITKATATADYTLQVETAEPDSVLPARMYRLKMMSPTATDASVTEKPVGTGPYTMVKWDRGQQVVLTANPT